MQYQVGDFLIRLKNASLARRKTVVMPYSSVSKAIGELLVKERFLEDFKEEVHDGKKSLIATIRYEKRFPVLMGITLISKPSLRVYAKAKQTKTMQRKRMSTVILSTSHGLLTAEEAQKKGVGGEYLFEVW